MWNPKEERKVPTDVQILKKFLMRPRMIVNVIYRINTWVSELKQKGRVNILNESKRFVSRICSETVRFRM